MNTRAYQYSSRFYDITSGTLLPYSEIANLINQKIVELRPAACHLMEIACGTGNLTIPLAQPGYTIEGLDLSPEMLEIARSKTRQAGLAIDYYCQDMQQSFPVNNLDAIICFFGGLNHLASIQALQKCFDHAYAALAPGGLLIFDQFSPAKMQRNFSGQAGADFGSFFVYQEGSYDALGKVTQISTYFIREENGYYSRAVEEQQYTIFPFEEITASLEQTGFKLQSCTELLQQLPGFRILKDIFLFVAQKTNPSGNML